tara:strand:+ start:1572 stop:1724 length:153 start_codon:yes stop_codon:yes gene_type:complete
MLDVVTTIAIIAVTHVTIGHEIKDHAVPNFIVTAESGGSIVNGRAELFTK